ncbi:MAG: hypothetical protein WCO86_14255 [Planctomycetota bacterium]
MEIVIDKSFLWSAPRHQLATILDEHQAFMPDVLFYELIKDDESRAALFRRLPQRDNPIGLAPGTGELLRYEIETRKTAMPLAKHAAVKRYRFNPRLTDKAMTLEPWMTELIEGRNAYYLQRAEQMAAISALMPNVFPGLRGHRAGGLKHRQAFEAVRQAVGSDDWLVRRLYSLVGRHDGWPRPDHVRRPSALFRVVQTDCLYAIDLFERYEGTPSASAVANQIEHDVRDKEYAVTSLLTGALATRDRRLANIVRSAEPRTTIIGFGKTSAFN